MGNLASSYLAKGRVNEAILLFDSTLKLARAKLEPEHPITLTTMNYLGEAHLVAGNWTAAADLLRECMGLREKIQPEDWRRFWTMSQLGAALTGQMRYSEAEPLLVQGYEGVEAREATIPAPFKKRLSETAARIVPFYEAWEKPEQAEQWRKKLALKPPYEKDKPKP
jgi:hypothetical protein